MTQAGVQAGALVSQGQRAVRVGEVVEEDAASDGQTHRAQASGSQTGALGLGSVVNIRKFSQETRFESGGKG